MLAFASTARQRYRSAGDYESGARPERVSTNTPSRRPDYVQRVMQDRRADEWRGSCAGPEASLPALFVRGRSNEQPID